MIKTRASIDWCFTVLFGSIVLITLALRNNLFGITSTVAGIESCKKLSFSSSQAYQTSKVNR